MRNRDLLILALEKDHNNQNFNPYHLIVDVRPLLNSMIFNTRLISV